MAMGSEDGTVWLYEAPCSARATAHVRIGVRQPITAMDISPNEAWIVATCPHELAVFSVIVPGTDTSGFVSRITGPQSPVFTLTPRPRDQQIIAARNGGVLPEFTHARFDCRGGRVVSIIAGLGHAILSWPFRAIENGQAPAYSIQFLQREHVIDALPVESITDLLYIAPNQYSWAPRQERRRR
jgi:hypothetical protein